MKKKYSKEKIVLYAVGLWSIVLGAVMLGFLARIYPGLSLASLAGAFLVWGFMALNRGDVTP